MTRPRPCFRKKSFHKLFLCLEQSPHRYCTISMLLAITQRWEVKSFFSAWNTNLILILFWWFYNLSCSICCISCSAFGSALWFRTPHWLRPCDFASFLRTLKHSFLKLPLYLKDIFSDYVLPLAFPFCTWRYVFNDSTWVSVEWLSCPLTNPRSPLHTSRSVYMERWYINIERSFRIPLQSFEVWKFKFWGLWFKKR